MAKFRLLGAVISLSTLVGCSNINNFKVINNYNYDNGDEYKVGSFSYETKDVSKIKIDWVAGNVNILQSNNDTLNVVESGKDLIDQQKVHYLIKDNVLQIKYCQSGYIGKFDVRKKNINIEIPSKIDLECSSVSSSINVNNVDIKSGDFSSTSGTIKIDSIITDDLKISTTSGNIESKSIICPKVNIESISGVMKIGSVKNNKTLNIISTSSIVDIEDLQNENTYIKTVSGITNIKKVNSKKAELVSTSGMINLIIEKLSNLEVTTISGVTNINLIDESGIDVSLDTVSGRIKASGKYNKINNKHYIYEGTEMCYATVTSTSGNLILRKD